MAETTETLTKLIDLLKPLAEEEREKTVKAAMIFLGSPETSARQSTKTKGKEADAPEDESEQNTLPRKATIWLKQNGLELNALEDVFHIANEAVDIIAADVPGPSARQKTKECYLLMGIKSLLQNGEPTISDEEARKFCQDLRCFDSPNHAAAVKELGNKTTGNKNNGFVLTAPGQRAAAELLKQMLAPTP